MVLLVNFTKHLKKLYQFYTFFFQTIEENTFHLFCEANIILIAKPDIDIIRKP